jgi:hypothetical protein
MEEGRVSPRINHSQHPLSHSLFGFKMPRRYTTPLSAVLQQGQRVRHVIKKDDEESTWIGIFNGNAIVWRGKEYTLSGFAKEHNKHTRATRTPNVNGWTGCEAELLGSQWRELSILRAQIA